MDTTHSLRGLYDKLGKGGPLDKAEIQAYLQELGAGKGLLGRVKIKAAVDLFMARFDKDPKDGGVSWKELIEYVGTLLPKSLTDSGGKLDVTRAGREFESRAHGETTVDYPALETYVRDSLPPIVPENFAEALARLAMDVLDTDRDGRIAWSDVESAIDEYNREIMPP